MAGRGEQRAVIQSFFLSIRQLGDKPIARVFLKSLAVTLLVFAAAFAGLWFATHWIAGHFFGTTATTGSMADLATLVMFLLAAWLLFRAIAIAVIGIFADEVVVAVERRHYPDAHSHGRDVSFVRSVAMGLGSAGRAILVNVLLSPLYLALLLTGVGTAVAFFLVNAWLLGRDLGDMVAARHMPGDKLPAWRRRTGIRRFLLGAAGTGMFLVPILNLAAPVLGAAMATHLFHRGRKT